MQIGISVATKMLPRSYSSSSSSRVPSTVRSCLSAWLRTRPVALSASSFTRRSLYRTDTEIQSDSIEEAATMATPALAGSIMTTSTPAAARGHRLFVYGSLRPDINPSIHQRYLGKCVPVGSAYFQGRMFIVDKRTDEEKQLGKKETTDVTMPSEVRKYPAVIPSSDANDRVFGLVYDIPEEHTDEVLRAMDEYEDCVGIPEGLAEYRRERVTVHMATHNCNGDHHPSSSAKTSSSSSSSHHQQLETWMYVWAQEVNNLVRVESGDYRSVYVKAPPSASENGGDLATA